jgi:hypothetical protein
MSIVLACSDVAFHYPVLVMSINRVKGEFLFAMETGIMKEF